MPPLPWLQECLRLYGIPEDCPVEQVSGDGRKSGGVAIWNALQSTTREVVHPYLRTRYRWLDNVWQNRPTVPENGLFPVAVTFRQWVTDWSAALICQLEPICEDPRIPPIFKSCHGVMQQAVDLARFLMPHLVLNVVLSASSAQVVPIVREAMAALNAAAGMAQHAMPEEMCLMAAQEVFSIYDQLHAWSCASKAALPRAISRSSSRGNQASIDAAKVRIGRVDTFLGQIPLDVIAQPSYNCKDHARALMHLESFLRATPAKSAQAAPLLQVGQEGPCRHFLVAVFHLRANAACAFARLVYAACACANYV